MKKEYDFSKGKRGAVIRTPPGKTRITIRLDDELLTWFRKQVHAMGGGNYQTLINEALRKHIASEEDSLPETLRSVVQEELMRYADGRERELPMERPLRPATNCKHDSSNFPPIQDMIQDLSRHRRIFHSESDFQHAFAWSMHCRYPNANIRPEMPMDSPLGRLRIDLIVELHGEVYAFEFKYKTRSANVELDGEKYQLASDGAQPLGRYDFWKDVQRLESLLLANKITCGFAILLTNDSAYWKRPLEKSGTSVAFSIHDKRYVEGCLDWAPSTGESIKKKRDKPIALEGSYELNWQTYSKIPTKKYSEFKLLPLKMCSSTLK